MFSLGTAHPSDLPRRWACADHGCMASAARRGLLGVLLGGVGALGLACAGGTGVEEGGVLCEPGLGQMCTCPGGQSSVSWCRADGQGFLPCECEGGDEGFGEEETGFSTSFTTNGDGDGDGSGNGDGDGDPTDSDSSSASGDGDGDSDSDSDGESTGSTGDGDGDEPNLDEACYPGPQEDYTVCFPVVTPAPVPAGYDYPGPYQGNPNYRSPVRYLDLDAIDSSASVAPNFSMNEFVQSWKGRYAVLSPAAVAYVQDMRDVVGPIVVNSGFRPPGYNAMIGGATHSRHMYGDAFDLDPVDVTLATLESVCTDNDGFLVEYESHVHCDWRFVDVDPVFFGYPDQGGGGPQAALSANLERSQADGRWRAPAAGFDEGEPVRRWTAYDEAGEVIDEARGRSYAAPEGAVRVEVLVGAQVRLSSLDAG